jgi:hypothetical protein
VEEGDEAADKGANGFESEGESNDEIEDPEPDFTPLTWKQAMACKNANHWIRAAKRGNQGNGTQFLL